MIIRDRPSVFALFFIMRGSILPHIKWHVLAAVAIAVLVTVSGGQVFHWKVTLTPIPFSLMGLALAIFLGFRNTASYDRWCEGRKLWGEYVHSARSAARLILTHMAPQSPRDTLVRRLIAFGYVFMHHLRGTEDKDSAQFLSTQDQAALKAWSDSRPDGVLHLISRDLAQAANLGQVSPMMVVEIERNLGNLAQMQAGSERIHSTPLPFSYSLLLHRTASIYCLSLPFGLVDSIGIMTPFVVGFISYTFFGLDALGGELEEPFGLMTNDLPLAAICRRVEIDLLIALGDPHPPAPLQPQNYCLL